MSTPSTFFESIDHRSIADGFIGRFIISISDARRSVRKRVASLDVPENILNWITKANERSKADISPDVANEAPHAVTVQISEKAWVLYETAAQFFIEQADRLEEYKMDDLNNRCHEFVLRLSLIAALSENIDADIVDVQHVEWATAYVKAMTGRVIAEFKQFIAGSEYESKKKEALVCLRKAGAGGMTLKDMNKKQPFSKWQLKERKEIIDALVEAELIFVENKATAGRPVTTYFAGAS